jgi:hypothetical protein
MCWRMRAPSGKVLTCGVYRTAAGFEARMGYGEQLVASHFSRDVEIARENAEGFRQAMLLNPKFEELPRQEIASIEPVQGGRIVRHGDRVEVQISGDELAREIMRATTPEDTCVDDDGDDPNHGTCRDRSPDDAHERKHSVHN